MTVSIHRKHNTAIQSFLGVAQNRIDMLFVSPEASGHSIGHLLTEYATPEFGSCKVDVNEQNLQAVVYYKCVG